jgi:protein AroM
LAAVQKKLATITIGQSPRIDLVPELQQYLGDEIQIIEFGALDDYTLTEIENKFSPGPTDQVLVSRLRNGAEVKLAERHIVKLIQQKLELIASQNFEIVLLLCTGKFSALTSSAFLIQPQPLLYSVIKNLIWQQKELAVIVPKREQIELAQQNWLDLGINAEVTAASPYQNHQNNFALAKAAAKLKDKSAPIIYLDCMGYNQQMKKEVAHLTGKQVVLAREMAALVIKGLF